MAWLKGILLIAAAIGILLGAKYLTELLIKKPARGEAPAFALQLPIDFGTLPELPAPVGAHVVRKIRSGDAIGPIARAYGLPDDDVNALASATTAFETDHGIKKLLPAKNYVEFTFNDVGDLESVAVEPESGKKVIFERMPTGSFRGTLVTLKPSHSERIAVGIIESSFAAAAAKAGVRYDIVDDLVDLFSNRVEFKKDFHTGDRFTVIYRDMLLSDGRPAGGSQILAAALEVNGEHLVAARYVGTDGKARFFNEKAELLGNSFLRYPLKFSRISSVFTQSRFHPVLKISRPHNGVDFAAPIGTPVRSVAEGLVVFAGAAGGSGNMVKIKHGPRYSTAYLHLSAIAKGLSKGASVHRGDVIGAVGMTGLATGPHLHFSFYDNEKYVDPLSIKLPMLDALGIGTKIDPSYLKRVLFTLQHYQTVALEPFYTN